MVTKKIINSLVTLQIVSIRESIRILILTISIVLDSVLLLMELFHRSLIQPIHSMLNLQQVRSILTSPKLILITKNVLNLTDPHKFNGNVSLNWLSSSKMLPKCLTISAS